jgi:DNA-3-methyladenine glycosylase II
MRVAQTIKRRLVEAYDNRFEVDDTEVWAFPDLDQLRSLGADDLGSLVGNQRKAGYLHGAFEALADVDEEFLRHGPYDEVRDFLLSIPGIGPWSASFVLIRGLGRSEDIPFEKEAASAASRIYGRELDEDEFRQLAAR